jgi:DNA polymerase I-like protein with 3'-5' exonuclease and polymerase domains
MDGFYVSIIGMVIEDDGVITDRKTFLFDHKDAPTDNDHQRLWAEVQAILHSADVIVAHNLKHDMNIGKYYGIQFDNLYHDDQKYHCTMVAEYLIRYQAKQELYSLDATSQRWGMPPKLDKVKTLYWAKGIDTYYVPLHLLEEYVLDDAEKCVLLRRKQIKALHERKLNRVFALQMEWCDMLSDMELNGVHWNQSTATGIMSKYQRELEDYDRKLDALTGCVKINWSSNYHLSAVLYGGSYKAKWREWTVVTLKSKPESKYYEKPFEQEYTIKGVGFPRDKRNKTSRDGIYKTDKDTIKGLVCKTKQQRDLKKLLLARSVVAKQLETFRGEKAGTGLTRKVQPDGRLHPKYNMTVTATGRLSSSDPNGQNLPRGSTSPLKTCFVPRYDGIANADLSQIEWRDAAFLTQDPVMMKEINSGVDQHTATCTSPDMMNLPFSKDNRFHAKTFNFRMIYGGSPYGFYMDPDMPNFSLKKYTGICDGFKQKYHVWDEDNKKLFAYVLQNGGTHTICTGRGFTFYKVARDKETGQPTYSEAQVANYRVQGLSGGDILPLAAVIIYKGMKAKKMKSIPILTVHDSLVFDYVKEELEELAKLCIKVFRALPQYIEQYYGFKFNVNLDGEFEFGPNYGKMEYQYTLEKGIESL